ncbi:Alpha/Beta hydrolase protein [Lipomyces oligophaga]|uniref:Alpha/Beta hydrolase protein n=1 Tax=Lipomyces oligophaga TaxID=45792 RepID=UPI0034CF974D
MAATTEDIGLAPEWMELEKKLGGRPLLSGDTFSMRAQMDGLTGVLHQAWGGMDIPGVTTIDTMSDSNLPVRVYLPDEALAAGKKVPLGVYYHCGGYCIGSIEADDVLVRNLCLESQTILISVEYRLAPEYVAPVALQDSCDLTEWAIKTASKWGADTTEVYTIGGSAGAALAVSVYLKLYDEGKATPIRGIVSLSPCWVHPDKVDDYKGEHKSFINSNGRLPVIDANSMISFYNTYKAPLDDKYIFAFNYENFNVIRKIYIVAAELDPLLDDSAIFDRKLSEQKVNHKYKMYESLPHVFWLFPLPQSKQFFKDTAKGIKYVLS